MNIDKSTLCPLETIIKNIPLPVVVRKPNWTNNFTFRVERIQNGVAYGTSFKNGIEYHRIFGEYSFKLFEKFFLVDAVRFNSVDDLFSEKENELFNEVFFKSLYDVKCSGTDAGIYEQCEVYLRDFLSAYGFDLNDEDHLHIRECLLKSSSCKKYSEQLEHNLDFFTEERSYIPWDRNETKVSNILDAIVQTSIQNNRPLTRQYARILASRYYVFESADRNVPIANLYRNLFAFLSEKEFNAWVIDDENCFERIVKRATVRIKKCLVSEIDEQAFVSQLIQTKKFVDISKAYPFVLDNARKGKYHQLVDAQFNVAKASSRPEKTTPNETGTKKAEIAPKPDSRTGLERFLDGIAKRTPSAPSQFSAFWNGIGTDLNKSESAEGLSIADYFLNQNGDKDIESLMY